MEEFQQLLWSFGAIIALLLLCMFVVRFWRRPFSGGPKSGQRLAVLDAMTIDPEHRLILVRCDGREHLLLIGRSGALIVESNIQEQKTSP